MIQLICTHCRATLEMDDGFAGGACRCRHCGTIQTVPSKLKSKTARVSRTLYQAPPDGVPSSGLDQLANVVASSGLSSTRLRKASPTETAPTTKPQTNVKILLIGAAAIIVVLCGALIFALTHSSAGTGQAGNASAAPSPSADTPVADLSQVAPQVIPNFAGIHLTGDTIVYVLDRGDATRDTFDALKAMTIKSLATLGERKQFQVIFWNNGKDDAYPKNWPTFATADNRAEAERAIEAITPHGKTDIRSAMRNAMSAKPTEIVIATGKAWDLDDAFVKTVDQVRGDRPVKIDTIALGEVRDSAALKMIAKETKGTFKQMNDTELKDVTR